MKKTERTKIVQKPMRPSITIVPNWRPGPPPTESSNLLAAALSSTFGSSGPMYLLGDEDDSTTGFAQEILYCRLSVSLSTGGVPIFAFLSGSGIFRDPTKSTLLEADIQDFMAGLASVTPTSLPALYNADAPNILVKVPCYIVIELHPPTGLKFVNGDAAIKLQTDLSDRYCNLWHYGVDWIATPNVSPTTEDCVLIYFGVHDVADASLRENDRFNINLQNGDQPEATLIIVDPAIKNRGPKPPGMLVAGSEKTKEKQAA